MGQFLRRVLWLLPALVIVTVLGFWLISGARLGDSGSLPTFVNLRTENVSTRAWRAAEQIALTDSSEARARLVRLGGAALPYVLPRLDSLRPEGRERVALALIPVAQRMGLQPGLDPTDGPRALSLWVAFWEEHFVDFRSTRVKRMVERAVDRATEMRTQELTRLDTFALEAIMTELARLTAKTSLSLPSEQDALLVLTNAAAHATGLTWTLPEGASANQARRVVSLWLSWWAEARFELTAPQGIERFLAPLLQTRYASWAREAARTKFGVTESGTPTLAMLAERLPFTLALCFSGWCGLVLGTLFAALLNVAQSATVNRRITIVLWLVTPTLVWWASHGVVVKRALDESAAGTGLPTLLLAAFASALWGGLLALRQHLATESHKYQAPWARHYRSMGIGPVRLGWLALRHSGSVSAARLLPNLARILTAVTVLEVALDVPGLGPATLQAVETAQVNWLMAITIATAAAFGLLQIFADTWQHARADLTPRFFRSRMPHR